jgi:alpha-mannosidase
MLPDCFGFPSSLPSILAHSGVTGFSTQKLVWGSSADGGGLQSLEKTPEGTPFSVGVWVGPDGTSVLAALNPGSYNGNIETDLSAPLTPSPDDPALVEVNRKIADLQARQESSKRQEKAADGNDAEELNRLRRERSQLPRRILQ